MKESMWGYMIISLGVIIIAILLLVQRLTTTNEEDFYLGREVMEAAMIDAVDYGTYRTTGKLVMSEEKFVEVFLRRFAESVTNNKDFKIDFYQIYEYPPKATVRIRTTTGETNIKDNSFSASVDTVLHGILETYPGTSDLMSSSYVVNLCEFTKTGNTISIKDCAEGDYCIISDTYSSNVTSSTMERTQIEKTLTSDDLNKTFYGYHYDKDKNVMKECAFTVTRFNEKSNSSEIEEFIQ